MESERTLFIGTTNPGKVAEFVSLLAPLGLKVEVIRSDEEIDEPSCELTDGFLENARTKALRYSELSPGVTLAEDSGLSVAYLGGYPGIFSARFFDVDMETRRTVPSGRSREEMDALNNARVMELMKGVPQSRRAAAFRVAVVLAREGKVLFTATAETHGWMAEDARGENGFGYDPVFVGQDTYGKTYAEIDPVRKNLKSHRKRVMDELFFWLSRNLEIFGS